MARGECQSLHDVSKTDGFVELGGVDDCFCSQLLDSFNEPAYLLNEGGRVLFANAEARRQFVTPPSWLAKILAAPSSTAASKRGRARALSLNGRRLWLVLPHTSTPGAKDGRCEERTPTRSLQLEELPESLGRVAKLLVRGLSDRQIANCTDLTYRSVRTYTTRLYRRLGVSGRQELLARLLEEKQVMDDR